VLFCPSCSMILSIDPAAGVKAFQMREPPVAGAALRPLAEAPGGELFQCRLFLRQLRFNALRHRQNGCRSVQATVLVARSRRLHDNFGLLFSEGDLSYSLLFS
jgi:hypothetical protein